MVAMLTSVNHRLLISYLLGVTVNCIRAGVMTNSRCVWFLAVVLIYCKKEGDSKILTLLAKHSIGGFHRTYKNNKKHFSFDNNVGLWMCSSVQDFPTKSSKDLKT